MNAKELATMRRARELSREVPDGFIGRDGFMFVAYGCVVFERENDKGRIEYIATNLTTGKSETIDRRANRVSDRAVDTLLRELANSRVAGMGRYEVDSETMLTLSKLREVVYAIFRAMRHLRSRYGLRQCDNAAHVPLYEYPRRPCCGLPQAESVYRPSRKRGNNHNQETSRGCSKALLMKRLA